MLCNKSPIFLNEDWSDSISIRATLDEGEFVKSFCPIFDKLHLNLMGFQLFKQTNPLHL